MVHEFRSRLLKIFYTFVVGDAMFVSIKTKVASGQKVHHDMIGIDIDGHERCLVFGLLKKKVAVNGSNLLSKSKVEV